MKMKTSNVFYVFLLAIALLDSTLGNLFPKRDCAPGTHYVLYCPRVLEETCTKPQRKHPKAVCDVPDCFCDRGTVRDHHNDCVHPDDCHRIGDLIRGMFDHDDVED